MRGIFCEDLEKNYVGHIMSEIYKDKIYEPFMKKDMTILEVGGNVGIATLYLSQFAKKLYVLEPAKQHLKCLRKTVKFNKLTNVTVIPKALSNVNGKRTFYHCDLNTTMFTLKPGEWTTTSEVVSCISIETLLKDIDSVDFMKLDAEGSEIDIIDSFGKEAKKIKSLVVEYHSWCGHPPEKLEELLTATGFAWQKAKTGFHYYAKRPY